MSMPPETPAFPPLPVIAERTTPGSIWERLPGSPPSDDSGDQLAISMQLNVSKDSIRRPLSRSAGPESGSSKGQAGSGPWSAPPSPLQAIKNVSDTRDACPLAALGPFLLYVGGSSISRSTPISDRVARGFNRALAEAFKGSVLGDPSSISLISLDDVFASLDRENLQHVGWRLAEAARALALPAVPAVTRFHQIVLCVADRLRVQS